MKLKIEKIEILPLRLHIVEARNDSSQDALIVRVHTDEGISGLGEADSSPTIVKAVIEAPRSHGLAMGLREALLGRDPLDIRGRWHDMLDATLYLGRGSVIAHSMSAIEMALWDVRGRAEGQPVWRLLAPALASPVGPRAYGTVLAPKNEAELRAVRDMAEAESLVGLKVAWGGGDPVPGGDEVAYLKQVRRVIGPDLEIRVDLCCSWREDALAKPWNEYAALGVRWLEEPFPPARLDLYAAMAERCEVPIAAGENESTLDGFKALVDAGVRVLQPDVSRCGGLCAAQAVAALARRRGVQCVPHVWSTGINVAATVHWAIATGSPLVERSLGTSPLHRELVLNVPALTNGRFEVPAAPGLGIDLDQDQVERYLDREAGGRATSR